MDESAGNKGEEAGRGGGGGRIRGGEDERRGKEELLRGRLVVLLHGLLEIFSGFSFTLHYRLSCRTLGLSVPNSCFRGSMSQHGLIVLLLQLDNIPYCRCPSQASGVATATGTKDLPTTATSTALTIEVENMVNSDSMSPTSRTPGWIGLSQRWELKTALTEGSTRHYQQTLLQYAWACRVSPVSSPTSGSNSSPGSDQLTVRPLSLPQCPRHMDGGRSCLSTTKSIIDLQVRAS